MKLHLPTRLRSAVFSCFAAVSALCTTLSTGTLVVYATSGTSAYAAYNAATATFEGTDNGAINPTAATYSGVETLIFNMGTSNTGNHLSNDSWTYAGNIQIGAAGATETGFCLNNGNRNQTDVFTGKVTGTGLLSKTGAGTNLTIAFEGDVTEFTGAIRLGSTAPFTLRFGGGSSVPAGQSADHGVSGTGDITFTGWANDTLVYNYSTAAPVYITNRISTNAGATSQVALNGSAHYVLTKDASISSLTLAADNTLHIGTTGKSSATVLGALTMGAGAAVHIDNGSLEVMNASSLAGTYAVGAAGVLHLSRTADLDGALTVAQGGALSIGALSGFADAGGGLQTPAAGENGFASVNGKLSILTGSADKLQALAGTTVLREGGNLELAGDGTVTISEVDHSVYYLRSGEKTLSSLVAESENKLTRIEMGTGGKLAVESGAVQGSYSVESARSVDVSEFGASTIAADIRMENLSATENVTVASGATLSIGSTAEGFSRNINLSADSHLVFEADAPTVMSVGSIINTAGSKDDFRRSVRVGEGVSLQASSFVNSWGLKSLTVDGEMNISGALSYETGGEYKGNNAQTNLIDGSGHITAGSLNISNASDNNTISVHELTINGASYIGRATTISAGTTELLGTATVSAALNLTGGHLILGDELSDTATLSGDINLSAGELTLNGTTSLGSNLHQTGGTLTVNGELTQTATLTASGTIALNGTLKADSAALDAIGAVSYSEGVNGYRQGTFVLVNKGEGALSLQRGEQGAVLLDGADATSFLSADAAGNILLADTVGSVYHVFEGEAVYGGDTSTVDTARTTGFGLHGGSLSLLAEREGGHHLNLTADADVTLGAGVSLAAASVTGAEHLTLSGAGTYVVNTLEEIAAVTRSESWTGTTLINARISNLNDETELSHSGNLNFLQQTTAAPGGVISNRNRFILADNGSLTFSGNVASCGGAIENVGSPYNIGNFMLTNNGDVIFSGNKASSSLDGGGAIFNYMSTFTLSENGAVSFTGNAAADGGGAIENVYATFSLSGNGDVTFTKNTATSFSNSHGGAIANFGNSDTFTLSNNGNVTFSENAAQWFGGAISNSDTFFSLSGNGDVTFAKNTATRDSYSYGGAIANTGSSSAFTLSGNGDVSFSENAAQWFGGAIYNRGAFTLNGNGDVTFAKNTATSSDPDFYPFGGAIANTDSSSTFTLSDNMNVIFSGNTASDVGGAIYNRGDFTLSGNRKVNVSRNTSFSQGGAIHNNAGTITLKDNGDVLFEKNAEIQNGSYRLRSIYSHEGTLNLSASEGKSITFRDSVYASGTVNLNTEGCGDIIFTGATTVADLREMKGSSGTKAEIEASRTTELGNVTLGGGRLMIQDDAILKVANLAGASTSSVVVESGTLTISEGGSFSMGAHTFASGDSESSYTGYVTISERGISGADANHKVVLKNVQASYANVGGTYIAYAEIDSCHFDLAKRSEVYLTHADLFGYTRFTDDPATIVLQDVTVELRTGVNTTLMGDAVLSSGVTLVQNDNAAVLLTLAADAKVSLVEAITFDTVTLTGDSLVLNCTGFDVEIIGASELIGLSFTSGSDYATFDSGLSVTLTLDGVHYANAYRVQDGSSTILYFDSRAAGATPEPATATLSLLALAALAARRKRK